MDSILNPGSTPIQAGFLRGIFAGLLLGAAEGLREYVFEGFTVDQSVARGVMVAIPVWLGLLGYGASDQARANSGKSAPADVPVQIVSQEKNITPAVVAQGLSTPNATTQI